MICITPNKTAHTKSRCYGFTIVLLCLLCPLNFSATVARAVTPETALYSDQIEIRTKAYETKEKLLGKRIAATKDEVEKNNLLLQQQLLDKLNEIQDETVAPFEPENHNELLHPAPTWEHFEDFIDKYTSITRESKTSTQNLKDTTKQKQTLYSQLLSLAGDDPEQDILQLQHAYQARKLFYQIGVDKNLKQRLDHLKEQFPSLVKQLHIEKKTITEQQEILARAKTKSDTVEEEKNLAIAAAEVLIQEQESVLAGYLGQDHSDTSKKQMHYSQLKLLELQTEKIDTTSQLYESMANLYREEQKLLWFQLLGPEENYFGLTDLSGDINKKIIHLRKETNALTPLLHSYETQLSTLRGGNALIGPKAQDLLSTLDKKIQTTGTQLSAVRQEVITLAHSGSLLEKAIDFKQSSLRSMVTRTREATDEMIEKVTGILTYPILSYNGMTLSLLLFIEVLCLLLVAIIINRIYAHTIAKTGAQRNWSERTIHLIQATGKYPFILIVVIIILSIVGINTSSLALVAGALSVGIGFGMQTIVNNLVSGIILLFDKSIQPGDFISLGDSSKAGGFRGNVVQMNTRATVLRTNDNINIIIPNSEMIASKVVNWTYGDEKIRYRIPFSVAYGTDIEQVKTVIKEGILSLPAILSHPEPQIWLTEHGSSALSFVAAIWVEGLHARQSARISDLVLCKIYTTLAEYDIEIPYPQMDLRLRSDIPEQAVDAKTIIDRLHQKVRGDHLTEPA